MLLASSSLLGDVVGLIMGIALIIVCLAFHLANYPRMPGLNADWTGVAVLLLFACHSFLWVASFSSQQGSDFGVYYKCGIDLQERLAENIEACQSHYISYGDLYWRRSLLYTVPIGWFGGSYFELKMFNAFLQTASATVLWFAVRARVGSGAALIVLLIFLAMPERIYALSLATPDNIAVLLIVIGLAVVEWMERTVLSATIAGLIVGMAAVGLDFSRSVGVFLLVAALVSALLQSARSRSIAKSGAFLGAVVVSYLSSRGMLSALAGEGAGDGFLRLASSLVIESDDVRTSFNWIHYFWPAIPEELRFRVGILRIFNELLSNGADYPFYIWKKAQSLTAGNGYLWFASADLTANLDTSLAFPANVPDRAISLSPLIVRLAIVIVLALVIRGAIVGRFSLTLAVAMLFFSFGCGVILFIGEVQPRYFLILTPAAIIVSGSGFSPSSAFGRIDIRKLAWGGSVLLIAAMFVPIAWLSTKAWLTPIGFEIAEEQTCDAGHPKTFENGNLISFTIPQGSRCAGIELKLTPGNVGVFVSDGQFPLRSDASDPNELRYAFATEDARVDGRFGVNHVQWVELSVHSSGTLRFSVERNSNDSLVERTIYLTYPTRL